MKIDFIKDSFLEDAIITAKKRGAQEAEVFFTEGRKVSIDLKNQKIEASEDSIITGFGIRVFVDKRMGFSYATNISGISRAIDDAINSSRWTEPDINYDLPLPSDYPDIDIFDRKMEEIDTGYLVDRLKELERAAFEYDRRIKRTRKVSIGASLMKTSIFNTNGLRASYAHTSAGIHIMVVAEDGSDSQSAWEFSGSRFLDDLDFRGTGERVARRALSLLGAKRIESKKIPVLFEPMVAVEFLEFLSSSFSAEEVVKGKSLLQGRLNEEVLSPLIDIKDDPFLPRMQGSRPFDAEGSPSQTTSIITNGVLKTYLHNIYTANRMGMKNTSNAVRQGYSSTPGVGFSNLVIGPSKSVRTYTQEELISIYDECLHILEVMGMHTANHVTGDFSVGVSGLWIKNGKVQFPVREAMIAGNVLQLFKDITALGDDTRFYGPIASPSILFRSMDISG